MDKTQIIFLFLLWLKYMFYFEVEDQIDNDKRQLVHDGFAVTKL